MTRPISENGEQDECFLFYRFPPKYDPRWAKIPVKVGKNDEKLITALAAKPATFSIKVYKITPHLFLKLYKLCLVTFIFGSPSFGVGKMVFFGQLGVPKLVSMIY